jgi:hypothetical protein
MSSTDTPEQRDEKKTLALQSIATSLAQIARELPALRMAAQNIANKR